MCRMPSAEFRSYRRKKKRVKRRVGLYICAAKCSSPRITTNRETAGGAPAREAGRASEVLSRLFQRYEAALRRGLFIRTTVPRHTEQRLQPFVSSSSR